LALGAGSYWRGVSVASKLVAASPVTGGESAAGAAGAGAAAAGAVGMDAGAIVGVDAEGCAAPA
jgi:hypothetical protein